MKRYNLDQGEEAEKAEAKTEAFLGQDDERPKKELSKSLDLLLVYRGKCCNYEQKTNKQKN